MLIEIYQTVHFYHGAGDGIQGIADIQGSCDVGVGGTPVPGVLCLLQVLRGLMGDASSEFKPVFKAQPVDIGTLEGERPGKISRSITLDVLVFDFLGDLVHAHRDDQQVFFSVE